MRTPPRPLDLLTTVLGRLTIPATASDDGEHLTIAGQTLAVRTRSLPSSTERILEPIAVHVLRQRPSARNDSLLIIATPRLPFTWQKMVTELSRFVPHDLTGKAMTAAGQAPGCWAICSEMGGYVLNGLPECAFRTDHDIPGMTGPMLAAAAIHQMRQPKVTDLMLSVLKLLLARTSPQHHMWFGEPGLDLVKTRDVMSRCGVSQSAAFAVVKELRERDWVVVDRLTGLRIRDGKQLMQWWLEYARASRPTRLALRSLFRENQQRLSHSDLLAWLKSRLALRNCMWAVNGWTACGLHERSFVTAIEQKPLTLALKGSLAHVMDSWGLALCKDPTDDRAIVHVDIVQSESVFFGGVVRDQLPCVDLWQAALDVCGDPNRGAEQAEAIIQELFPDQA
jgi:hypothetical protein